MTNNEAIDRVRELLADKIRESGSHLSAMYEAGKMPTRNQVDYHQLMEDADLLLCELLEK